MIFTILYHPKIRDEGGSPGLRWPMSDGVNYWLGTFLEPVSILVGCVYLTPLNFIPQIVSET